jgi:hypothetical protein
MSGLPAWEQLENRFFRRVELYEMDWVHRDSGQGIGLERYIVATGPLGGMIAMFRDPKVAARARAGQRGPTIDVFTASGFFESSIKWDKARIVSIGWSDDEMLVVVAEDATVHLYDVFKKTFISQFSMGELARNAGIAEARFCPGGRGCVILTKDDRFFSVANFNDPKPRRFASFQDQAGADGAESLDDPGGEPTSAVSSWAIHMNDRSIEVIVAANRNLFVLDPNEAWLPVLDASQLGKYTAMSVSPDNQLIALFGETGKIWVLSSDFTKNWTAFDTQSKVAPRQLVWCGSDAVVAYWDQLGAGTGTLLMVGAHTRGPSQASQGRQMNYINYGYDKRVHLMPEFDGLRIIGESHHEFLQAVPDSVEKIFQLGFSRYPGAMLYMARQAFEQKDPMADDLIRKIKDDQEYPDGLYIAIDQCIEAAGHEFETSTQRSLLRAARFGMDFADCPPEMFADMCQTLRVLFHVREYHVALPLTYKQYKLLSLQVVIDRLIARNVFWLAYEICKYLRLDGRKATNRVLVHWAKQLVKTDNSDDSVARTIISKLSDVDGVSYAEIARAASMEGKPDLAIRLLENEPKASEQVPILMSMNEDALALEKAVNSGDTGLAQFVLLDLYQKFPGKGEFLSFINTRPAARDLFLQYCRENDPELLKDFYFSHDVLHETANLMIIDAFGDPALDSRIKTLKDAARHYTNARDHPFKAKATEEQAQLLQAQKGLEKALKEPFVNLPLGDTLYQVVLQNDQERANKLRKDFKVPDKRFWWIKVKALADSNNWSELERFSKSKKSPIGYEAFADECIEKNNRFEAKKYIVKCLAENKVGYFVKIGAWEEAIDAALANRSDEELQMIEQACNGRRDVLKMIADRRR